MEFPFDHHHHHHHHRRDDDNDESDRFPPHFTPAGDGPESFHTLHSVHHISHEPVPQYDAPPPFFDPPVRPPIYADDPFPDVGYATPYGREEERHHPGYAAGGSVNRQQTVRVFNKADENYSLSISDGKVVLARKDPGDVYQHWIKDLSYSTKVKDEEGFPSFALINKVTGEALKHSIGATHPVRLVPNNPNFLDESVLWTESRDLGDGFRCIRMVNNIALNFDAFHGDEDHGGVHEGTIVVLWEWLKGNNQRWKIAPY